MSSKKYRKRLRDKVIMWTHRSDAARMFFNHEHDAIYQNRLSEIDESMSATETYIRSHSAFCCWYGSAYLDWLDWLTGGIELDFIIPDRKGKIRAKDLIVKEHDTCIHSI